MTDLIDQEGWVEIRDSDGHKAALRHLATVSYTHLDVYKRQEQLHLDAYLRHVHNWPRRLLGELLNGVVRGIGFSIGFTLLGALLLYILQNIALANLPVIGRFLADLVKIVENNL